MNMFTFDLRGKSGIVIFTLYRYRLGEGREYFAGYSTKKRLNSYAFYNIDTNDLKIVHYDYIKARVYDAVIGAYTINPGEKIIALKGFHCYYLDHTGQEIGYAGDHFFFYNYKIEENESKTSVQSSENSSIENNNQYQQEESVFELDGNRVIHNNGEIYESHYYLKNIIGNVIVCYQKTDTRPSPNWLYGICDNRGNLLSEIKYDNIYPTRNDVTGERYIRVETKDKYGLISDEGREILPVKYEFVDDWDWNIAVVDHGKKLIKIEDQSVLFETDGCLEGIVDGWIKVVPNNNLTSCLGFLDSSGNFYEFHNKRIGQGDLEKYSAIGASFHDGLLPVFSTNRGYGYVDIDGNEIIECKYCEISDFKNGKAKVRLDCEYGYIDTKGCMLVEKDGEEIAIPNKYDWAYNYKNGYFVVQKGKLYGALDTYLNEIIPCSFKTKEEVDLTYSKVKLYILFFSKDKYEEEYEKLLPPIRFEENLSLFEIERDEGFLSFSSLENHVFSGFKTINNDILFPPVLEVGGFVEGMAKINIFGKWGYINEKLELVIPPKYEYACDFSEGLALVHAIGEHEKFINKKDETVLSIDFHYVNVESFHGGVAKCEYDNFRPGKDDIHSSEITRFKQGYRTY